MYLARQAIEARWVLALTIHVFDFFSGCGGTSAGLRAAGMDISLAIDNDPIAASTYQLNFPEATFLQRDIRELSPADLEPRLQQLDPADPLLLCGCAPCQPFSKQGRRKPDADARSTLVDELARFVRAGWPPFGFCENVPGLQAVRGEGPFERFLQSLDELGYQHCHGVIDSKDYGVPQHRSRLVLLASRLGKAPSLPAPSHGPGRTNRYATVWHAIQDLRPLEAGECDPEDPVHRAANLSALNLSRIRATPPGETRLSWPDHLRLDCHRKKPGHTDVYGRLRKDQPATAMTTRCISLSNGRFGHPVQDRAITAREAACLQTFPREFRFTGSLEDMGRQIGNAVPVTLAQRFGEVFRTLASPGAA
jgi:DNA (cytosine-5)-methyltransferase 1